ncbi:MAG TPA: hypothetical protein VN231_07075 [Allosphingosinicella sp.]|nr:hypothetical protein [Allosphingosinicella sp.]
MAADEAERAARSHRNSYGLFTGLMKYGAIVSFVTAMLVIFIISN